MSELKERAIEARLAAGYEVPKQWAEALGVSASAIYQIEDGTTLNLSIKTAAPMAKLSGFSLDWLQHGRGPKKLASRIGEEPSAYLTIPMHSAQASAGHGAKNGEVAEIGSLLFRPRSLSKRAISEDAAQVWYCTGNSMFPRLREGDAVLFDTDDVNPRDGKLYVIEWGKDRQTYVKRLYHELDGALRVVSDNPAPEFRDRIVQPGDPGFRVLGRVRWIGSWED
jgi:phage repressor protein C with HTH and peptisase S24 domain